MQEALLVCVILRAARRWELTRFQANEIIICYCEGHNDDYDYKL